MPRWRPPPMHPMFKDDPDFEDVLKIMAENRKKMDEDPDVPLAFMSSTPTS